MSSWEESRQRRIKEQKKKVFHLEESLKAARLKLAVLEEYLEAEKARKASGARPGEIKV